MVHARVALREKGVLQVRQDLVLVVAERANRRGLDVVKNDAALVGDFKRVPLELLLSRRARDHQDENDE